MTKRVQFIGHDSATANQFTGMDREITVDYENWELRLHDGYTPGGHKILNRDQNDDRYQARNVELDGFLNWDPSERGIVTRLGPSNYQLRVIEVDPEAMEIQNPTGFAGNFQISFKSTITKDIRFEGAITYAESVTFEGGLTGDLTGDVEGNLTGDSNGTHTGNVVGNLTGNTAGTHTGGLDTREGTVQMAPGQIQLEWLSEEILFFVLDKVVPIGGCIPYHGLVADLPLNWALCDGTNGTPDYRNRTAIGASATYPLGTTGGSATHTHPLSVEISGDHTHSGIASNHALTEAQMPKHRHKDGVTFSSGNVFCYGTTPAEPSTPKRIDGNSGSGTLQGWTNEVGNSEPHSHGLAIDSGGAHSHVGTATESSNIPPYVSSNWIMRIS